MNWPNSGDELKRILTRTLDHSATVEMTATEAKAILRKARGHSPIVSVVQDSLLHASRYEGLQLQDDQLYAVMALELLRAHTEISEMLLKVHASTLTVPILQLPACMRQHVDLKT